MAESSRSGNGVPPKAAPEEQAALGTIKYPSDYVFKIMGAAADDFTTHATSLVARVTGPIPGPQVSTRVSSQGKYQSVSITVRLTSEDQRRAIYQALWEDKRILYYL